MIENITLDEFSVVKVKKTTIQDFPKKKHVISLLCPRCGVKHRRLEITRFKRIGPPLYFSHYGYCPKTKEPIVFLVADMDYGKNYDITLEVNE